MQIKTIVLAAAMLGVLPLACHATQVSQACLARPAGLLDALVHGDYAAANEAFSPPAGKVLTAAKLEAAWSQLQETYGAYRKHGASLSQTFQGGNVVITPVTFAVGSLNLLTACDASNRLTMIYFTPSPAGAAPASVQAHAEADGVRVASLDVASPLGPLRGALTLPAGKGPFPAVVLVAGSGPNDLDETVGGSKPFRDIAEGLARAGIASLRYDKRTRDYGLKTAANPRFTVDDEVTDDALTALHLLAKQKGIDPHRVFVLGHSLGAQMAPRIAQRDPQLAGVVMLAAPARPLLSVIAEQAREQGIRHGADKARIEADLKAIAGERALLDKADPAHPPQGKFGIFTQAYLMSLHGYHQVAVARSLTEPMLILQGGSDFQVSPTKDFDTWKKALAGKSDVTFRLFPGLSHLFTPAGKTLTAADYTAPAHVDPAVIETIANWIKAQLPAK
jgi:dienelactone hydrolase